MQQDAPAMAEPAAEAQKDDCAGSTGPASASATEHCRAGLHRRVKMPVVAAFSMLVRCRLSPVCWPRLTGRPVIASRTRAIRPSAPPKGDGLEGAWSML